MAKSDGNEYFKRTHLFWIVSVTLAFAYFTVIVFAPEKLPLESLGVFGSFCTYLVDNYAALMYKGWCASVGIHALESCVALMICSNKGINDTATRGLWFLQTFLFGYASLGLLVRYDPRRPKQH
ncbi:transmembrane protein 254 [Cololabis saira]|uniref:transmembrane protein 254 n=1 Tax=Cololabis saira TaxID=129043 RepID=UPI002AD233B2|nr:transmembrane protein 254 [Cololabis saira]